MNHKPETYPPHGKLEGRYANFLKVGHNALVFILDFAFDDAECEEPEITTRIITSPSYAKNFLETLQQSIQQYEKTYGKIPETSVVD